MSEHKADYTKDDLLAFCTFTDGVPKYIGQLMDVQVWKAWLISCYNFDGRYVNIVYPQIRS